MLNQHLLSKQPFRLLLGDLVYADADEKDYEPAYSQYNQRRTTAAQGLPSAKPPRETHFWRIILYAIENENMMYTVFVYYDLI